MNSKTGSVPIFWHCLFALFLLSTVGCGLLRSPMPAIDRTQDERILTQVLARLAAEPAVGADAVRVSVEAAVVTLHGSVPGIDGWNCAVRHAQLVDGVRLVVDYLVIERAPRNPSCKARSAPLSP